MKKKLLISLVIALIMGAGVLLWVNQQNEQKAQNQIAINEYEVVANVLDMNMDIDQFNSSGNPEDIVLIPTEQTSEMLGRWQAISESLNEIDFPKQAVEEEEWLHVYDMLVHNRSEMEDASRVLAEDASDESANSLSVYSYISSRSITRDYFRDFLVEEGIEKEEDMYDEQEEAAERD